MSPAEGRTVAEGTWRRFRLLLVALVLCRGLVLLCILPPFEGWDEYQHVGYVAHVAETGRPAVLGETQVPRSLPRAVAAFPHPRPVLEQIRHWGASDYETYWTRPDRPEPPPASAIAETPLYQAQHGPLYYRLAAPLFVAAGGVGDLRRSVGALRLANLALTTAAVWIALGAIGRLVQGRRAAALIALPVAAQPLFLINGLRVANDALGVLLATLAIAWCLTLDRRNLLWKGAGIGIVAGLAILAKAVHLGLLPFLGACGLMVAVRDRVSPARASAAALVIAAGVVAVTQAELRSNLARYGRLTATQEVVKNDREGRTLADLLRAAGRVDWARQIKDLWLGENLFVGGWSFHRPSRTFTRLHGQVGLLALLGWSCLALRRTRPDPPIFRSACSPMASLAVCLGYTAALAYHMVQSQLAWGKSTTNPWYASAASPWFVMLLAAGGLSWRPLGRLRELLPVALAALFLSAEAIVTWGLMMTDYTANAGGWEALRRLATLQPAALGTATLLAATAGELALVSTAIVVLATPGRWADAPTRAGPRRPHSPPAKAPSVLPRVLADVEGD